MTGDELMEIRLLLRFAGSRLNPTERFALTCLVQETPLRDGAREGGISPGGIWMAQRSGLKKMRRRLEMLGIKSANDLISRERVDG